jgi:primosomal protein DnaI
MTLRKAAAPNIDLGNNLAEIEEKYYQEIIHDPLMLKKIQELSLSDKTVREFLGILISYQDDCHVCEHCPGVDQCPKDNPRTAMALLYDGRFLTRTNALCAPYLAQLNLESRYLCRDFPAEWLSVNLSDLSRTNRIADVLNAFCIADKNSTSRWLFLNGEAGSGRSYILTALANDRIKNKDASVAFINANKRFDELKGLAITNRQAFDKRMKEFEECDLLVIDDFGSEYKSDYVRDQIVFPLLSERAKGHALTFFSSDFTLSDIQDLYSMNNRSAAVMAKQLVNLISSNLAQEPLYLKKGFESFLGQ